MEADDPRSQRFAVTPRGVNDVKCVVNAEGALAAADAAGSTKFPGRELPLIGWNPLGELRLRMLRAASLSSHDRDMVKVSSSESVGEWRCAPPMAMGVDCEMRSAASEKPFIVIGLTIDGEVTGGAAGCGTGAFRAAAANAPEVTRTRILFSPCASFNHLCNCAFWSALSAPSSSPMACAALGCELICISCALSRACNPFTWPCSSSTNCLCRNRACLADSALRANRELREGSRPLAPGAECENIISSSTSTPVSIVNCAEPISLESAGRSASCSIPDIHRVRYGSGTRFPRAGPTGLDHWKEV
mmetsp:Transcript_29286/g.62926  ORF Transcript_29286/g.62926 Transcript_29286/m.62926 type:complete len:304 (-) Transcript_29286:44-955(-)